MRPSLSKATSPKRELSKIQPAHSNIPNPSPQSFRTLSLLNLQNPSPRAQQSYKRPGFWSSSIAVKQAPFMLRRFAGEQWELGEFRWPVSEGCADFGAKCLGCGASNNYEFFLGADGENLQEPRVGCWFRGWSLNLALTPRLRS